ncbi:ABC transporter permease subunit [Planomicrobium sp. Y74]|uniref:ABC transporter permease n=1 Tax=Planomicrobium sp. Y74 TaxID=2478977 RepID=UPI000EF4D084|nr:ABC transporter permease subunit [Planomicrobium sp. Y74]RLQ90383.1 ABC transporter permease [Planomicrobium sp. Y74]
MNQFGVLLKKEWRENLRNYKLFWIPAVFILLGIMEPVSNYFLPQILDSVGNLPEGTVLEFPEPEPEQVMAAIMGQYQLLGLLIFVLAYMGTIAGERKSGTATLLYARPLSFSAYFMSKWVMATIIALLSVWLGFLAGYYYTYLLFGSIDFMNLMRFGLTYSFWILLVISIILAASALMPNAGLAAAVSLGIIFISQLVDGLLGTYWPISPLKLPAYAASWFENGLDMSDFWWSVSLTFMLIVLLVVIGILISAKKAASTKV